jgi:thymidylate kinase
MKPFIVEIVAGPSGGKTSLKNNLSKRLEQAGLSVICLGNKDKSVIDLRAFHQEVERRLRLNRNFPHCEETIARIRSLVFRIILLELNAKAQAALQDIVLFEHNSVYTFAIEAYGSGVPEYVLEYDIGFVPNADLVIYLVVSAQELRKRSATRMLWDEKYVARICAGLEKMYVIGGKKWLRIEAEGKTTNEIAEWCLPKLLAAYEEYCERTR